MRYTFSLLIFFDVILKQVSLQETIDNFNHCVDVSTAWKVSVWKFSGPYFPAFGLNKDQKNSEYRLFTQRKAADFSTSIYSFQTNVSFLYPLKTCFSGKTVREFWPKMGWPEVW